MKKFHTPAIKFLPQYIAELPSQQDWFQNALQNSNTNLQPSEMLLFELGAYVWAHI